MTITAEVLEKVKSREGFMTTGEVARRLGYTSRTVRRACANGEIPAIQVGTHWRIPRWWVTREIDKVAPKRRGDM